MISGTVYVKKHSESLMLYKNNNNYYMLVNINDFITSYLLSYDYVLELDFKKYEVISEVIRNKNQIEKYKIKLNNNSSINELLLLKIKLIIKE